MFPLRTPLELLLIYFFRNNIDNDLSINRLHKLRNNFDDCAFFLWRGHATCLWFLLKRLQLVFYIDKVSVREGKKEKERERRGCVCWGSICKSQLLAKMRNGFLYLFALLTHTHTRCRVVAAPKIMLTKAVDDKENKKPKFSEQKNASAKGKHRKNTQGK